MDYIRTLTQRSASETRVGDGRVRYLFPIFPSSSIVYPYSLLVPASHLSEGDMSNTFFEPSHLQRPGRESMTLQ